ncbi:hypothetical protein KCP76_20050 [Salmonella enterica subsp. enterica serovar Weltevreden]|nr:hypothetical protein KCP76_20050 [Salmonella enterica subsp. enterica serovar Weltevreden]
MAVAHDAFSVKRQRLAVVTQASYYGYRFAPFLPASMHRLRVTLKLPPLC